MLSHSQSNLHSGGRGERCVPGLAEPRARATWPRLSLSRRPSLPSGRRLDSTRGGSRKGGRRPVLSRLGSHVSHIRPWPPAGLPAARPGLRCPRRPRRAPAALEDSVACPLAGSLSDRSLYCPFCSFTRVKCCPDPEPEAPPHLFWVLQIVPESMKSKLWVRSNLKNKQTKNQKIWKSLKSLPHFVPTTEAEREPSSPYPPRPLSLN